MMDQLLDMLGNHIGAWMSGLHVIVKWVSPSVQNSHDTPCIPQELEKKRQRAERFGLPVPVDKAAELEKIKLRAQRFQPGGALSGGRCVRMYGAHERPESYCLPRQVRCLTPVCPIFSDCLRAAFAIAGSTSEIKAKLDARAARFGTAQ